MIGGRLEKVLKGEDLLDTQGFESFHKYLAQVNDPVVIAALKVEEALHKDSYVQLIKLAFATLREVGDDLELASHLLRRIAVSYEAIGESEASENYYLQCIEAAEKAGRHDISAHAQRQLIYGKFFKGTDYLVLRRELRKLLNRSFHQHFREEAYIPYLLSMVENILGNPGAALSLIQEATKRFSNDMSSTSRFIIVYPEAKGFALRLKGRLAEAVETFVECARRHIEISSLYSGYPLAKALEITRLTDLPSPPKKLVNKCARLIKDGSPASRAALLEIEALNNQDDAAAAAGALSAAFAYQNVNQHFEAFRCALTAAFLGWQAGSETFARAIRFLEPLINSYPYSKKDPILGSFARGIEAFLEHESPRMKTKGIRAYLLGEMKVFVDGRELDLNAWPNKKALKMLVYLLLSRYHSISKDHLFYLLWPDLPFDNRTRSRLYMAVSAVRKGLGRPELLVAKQDFYQLVDVWTDLMELERLIRRAETADTSDDKHEILSRVRQLAGSELLPGFVDDRYVDEYRQYYKRLRKRLFKEDFAD